MICGAGYGGRLTASSPISRFDREVRHRLSDTFPGNSSVGGSPSRVLGASRGRWTTDLDRRQTPAARRSVSPSRSASRGSSPSRDISLWAQAGLSADERARSPGHEHFATFCRLKPTIEASDMYADAALSKSPPWVIQSNRRRRRPATNHSQRGAAQAQSSVTWGATDGLAGAAQSTVSLPLTLSSLTPNFLDGDGRRTTDYGGGHSPKPSASATQIVSHPAVTASIGEYISAEALAQQAAAAAAAAADPGASLPPPLPPPAAAVAAAAAAAATAARPAKREKKFWEGMEHGELMLSSVTVFRQPPKGALKRVLRSPANANHYQRVLCTPPDR